MASETRRFKSPGPGPLGEGPLAKEFNVFAAFSEAKSGFLSKFCAGGVELFIAVKAGAALNGVKPPELTAVNPEGRGGGGGGGGGWEAGVGVLSRPLIDPCKAIEALIAGESRDRLEGVCWLDFLIGEGPGDGVP